MQQNPYAPPGPSGPPPQRGAEPPASISVVEAIKFSFSGVGFANLAIGLLMIFVPVVGGLMLMGWLAQAHRRLALRQAPAVPSFSFNDVGDYLMAGLPPFAAQMAGSLLAAVPLGIVGFSFAMYVASVARTTSEPSAMGLAIGGIVGGVMVTVLVTIVMVFITAMTMRGELTGSLKEAFNVSEVIAFARRNWVSVVVHHIVFALLIVPLMFVGVLAFFIGVYVVAIAAQFASMHLRWQLYERDIATGGVPVAVRADGGADL